MNFYLFIYINNLCDLFHISETESSELNDFVTCSSAEALIKNLPSPEEMDLKDPESRTKL